MRKKPLNNDNQQINDVDGSCIPRQNMLFPPCWSWISNTVYPCSVSSRFRFVVSAFWLFVSVDCEKRKVVMGVLFFLLGFGQPSCVARVSTSILLSRCFCVRGCFAALGCSFRHLRSAHVKCGTEILSVGNQRQRTYSFLGIVAAYFGYSRRQTDVKAAGIWYWIYSSWRIQRKSFFVGFASFLGGCSQKQRVITTTINRKQTNASHQPKDTIKSGNLTNRSAWVIATPIFVVQISLT